MIRLRKFDNPVVQEVRGRLTAYIDSRRFLLPAQFAVGQRVGPEVALPPPNPTATDRVKTLWFGIDVIGESAANASAGLLRWLLPPRFGVRFLVLLLGVNLVCAALVLLVPAPPLRPLAWGGVEIIASLAAILAFHELGHCAMARRLGIRVDGLGVGLYLVFPAMFSRISLAGLLDWRERIDLFAAGAVFQMYLTPVIAMGYFATETVAARQLLILNLLLLLFNMIPVLHFDGYRIVRELMEHRFGPRLRQRVGGALRIITIAFIISAGYALIDRLTPALAALGGQLTWRAWAELVFYLALLTLLVRVAPRWVRRPYG